MTESNSPVPEAQPPSECAKPEKPSKSRKELHVVPDEAELIEQEMSELFEEDRVTHQHGSAEPEGD